MSSTELIFLIIPLLNSDYIWASQKMSLCLQCENKPSVNTFSLMLVAAAQSQLFSLADYTLWYWTKPTFLGNILFLIYPILILLPSSFSYSAAFMVLLLLRINLCRVYKMDWLRTKTIGAKTRQRNVKENGAVVLKQLIECCDAKCNPIKNFSYGQIIKATDNFCQSNRASRIDVYYRCYKGMLDDRLVLIKKGKYTLDMKEICRDIAISSMVSGHKNFLKLLGCCLEFTPPVLVFEYAEIITLGPLLASHPGNLRRIKIAREVANALTYLHTAFSRAFIHSNLDPFTIFLDGNGVTKLGNFCNCIPIPEGETFVHDDTLQKYHEFRHNTLKGTHGLGVCNLPVIDPDYKSTGKVTTKTDMHSFGAFMLALVQIKEVDDELSLSSDMLRAFSDLFIKPYDDTRFPLHHHVTKILRKFGYAEVVDSDMSDPAAWPVKAFLRLALRCIGGSNLGDPLTSMLQVAKELRLIEKSTNWS